MEEEDHVVEKIHELVDFSLIMTYDYSSKTGKLGSNAPITISFYVHLNCFLTDTIIRRA